MLELLRIPGLRHEHAASMLVAHGAGQNAQSLNAIHAQPGIREHTDIRVTCFSEFATIFLKRALPVEEAALSEDHAAIDQQAGAAFLLKNRHTAGVMASKGIAYAY